MAQRQRITVLNDAPVARGRYVLYWMQQSQRAQCNHALEFAVGQANERKLPLLVCFGLMDDYPEANLRHYRFMLEGLRSTAASLKLKGIRFVMRHGSPAEVALVLAREAAVVVCDRGYLLHQRRWRDQVADGAGRRVVQVESDVVVPVEVTSDKAEFAARTIRPKIARHLKRYLLPLREETLQRDAMSLRILGDADLGDIDTVLASLKLDRTVAPVSRFVGGSDRAAELLKEFIASKLRGYSGDRSEPSAGIISQMSPYLHFGQISPLEIALAVLKADVPKVDKDAYLEELIVRRELACNYTQFTPGYDTYDALPAWARRSLERHTADRRATTYTREQLERAQTDDPYWNAAMRQMLHTGYMHNYMRMYWGKCVIGWKSHLREAFADLLYLNNKYFIDGRDPNSYAGVGWCFGLHDRPWAERPIFGQVRYMNSAGLDRKFDMDAYVRMVEAQVV